MVIVITNNKDLVAQLKQNLINRDIRVLEDIFVSKNYRRFLLNYTPAGLLRIIFRTLLLWVLARKLANGVTHDVPYTLIATHTHIRSFNDPGKFHDVYFGPLIPEAARSKRTALIVGLLYDNPFDQIRCIKKLKIPTQVVPLESLLTLKGLVLAILQSAINYCLSIKVKGAFNIGGANVEFLVKRAIRQSINSGEHFNNSKVLLVAKWLGRHTKPDLCIYPFEARSWEKMLITGLKSQSPMTKIIGYQHTSFSRHHTHLSLGLDEHKVTPLPDQVLTCGDVTAQWLSEHGGYPEDFIKPACALRFTPGIASMDRHGPARIRNILVVLATSQREYNVTPAFVERALVDLDSEFEVRVRTHPSLPELDFEETIILTRSNNALVEDLDWADVVIYSSSTVAMEAVFSGIPVIYVDNGEFLDTDPLLEFDGLKWTVQDPKQLVTVLNEIFNLSPKFLENRRKIGKDYVNRYLKPITEESLAVFWER